MRRRDLIRAGAAASGVGLLGSRAAWASWGDAPSADATAALLGPGVRAEKCLELFLYGGMTAFESFYAIPDYGRPDDPDPALRNTQWHLWADRHERVFSRQCGWTDAASWLQPWMPDANGQTVHLGPIVQPFRDRPDLLERLRVVVMRHDLEPHEAAIPLALSGFRLGNPRMAGMGAHLQRYHLDREPSRVIPFSYVFTPNTEISTDNIRVASQVGLHPGSARPLALTLSANTQIADLIGRLALGDDAATFDPLLAYYTDRARARYADAGGALLRSRAIDDHAYAVASLRNAPALAQVLTQDLFTATAGASCDFAANDDLTGMGIGAAVGLLQHPTTPARYVNVVDGGLETADGGGGYDTHFEHLETQASNLSHSLRQLADRINAPGEGDPTKLDLDETMVIITTDFGRTPYAQTNLGTNHHPYGYVQILLGGPIGADQAGVVGAIGPNGEADDYVTPGEFRAAALAAMGIYPFSPESFAVGDVRDVSSELEALLWLQSHVLGRS